MTMENWATGTVQMALDVTTKHVCVMLMMMLKGRQKLRQKPGTKVMKQRKKLFVGRVILNEILLQCWSFNLAILSHTDES